MLMKRIDAASSGLLGRGWGRLLVPTLFAGLLGMTACSPPPSTSPDPDGTQHPSRDAGIGHPSLDAGSWLPFPDSGIPSLQPDSGFPSADSGVPNPTVDAGPLPSRDGGVEPRDAASNGGANTKKDPTIPPIDGECPVFKSGTVTVGKLGGITLVVGSKASGPTAPLVFYWHGTGSTAGEYALMAKAVADGVTSEGGILASFQGSVGTGGDCSGTGIFSKDDFKVADQIVACAVRDYNIDPHRIYSTGCSAGGLQTGCMATLRSSYLAAAAPNSGGVVLPLKFDDPSHTPAIMTMHGGPQDNVVVSFATTSKSLDTQFKNAGGFVINCDHGGGHCGAPAALYKSVWDFFKAHPFGAAPEPYESGIPSGFPSYCQVF
jgi:predicted esterase